MKVIDRKKQQRAALDTLLKSMVQDGRIFAGELRKKWKSIAPYLNKKRLLHFLRENNVLLAKKAIDVIASYKKTLAKGIPPEMIAAGFLPRHSLISCFLAGGKDCNKGNGKKVPTSVGLFL